MDMKELREDGGCEEREISENDYMGYDTLEEKRQDRDLELVRLIAERMSGGDKP